MNEIQLPPIDKHDHPECRVMTWTELELEAIKQYATQAVTEDRAQRDADHLAELQAYELTVANLREQLALPETVEVLLCDFCGCETPDPWHGSTETDHHIHACDACKPKLWARQAPQAQCGEPVAWIPPEREGEFHHKHSTITAYRTPMAGWEPVYRSAPALQVPMTEDEIIKCLVESNCIGKVMMSFESGPYDITRTSINADWLVRAIEAHHGIKEKP